MVQPSENLSSSRLSRLVGRPSPKFSALVRLACSNFSRSSSEVVSRIRPGTSLAPTRAVGIPITSYVLQMGIRLTEQALPIPISVAAFTSRSFKRTLPLRHASVASLRVGNNRTHQRNLSRRKAQKRRCLDVKMKEHRASFEEGNPHDARPFIFTSPRFHISTSCS